MMVVATGNGPHRSISPLQFVILYSIVATGNGQHHSLSPLQFVLDFIT